MLKKRVHRIRRAGGEEVARGRSARMTMNNAQAFIIALCLCAIGAGLIYLGVYVVSAYSQSFQRDHRRTLAWDTLSTILADPWSAPVIVAGLTLSLGSIALLVGASIGVYILWVELSRALS